MFQRFLSLSDGESFFFFFPLIGTKMKVLENLH